MASKWLVEALVEEGINVRIPEPDQLTWDDVTVTELFQPDVMAYKRVYRLPVPDGILTYSAMIYDELVKLRGEERQIRGYHDAMARMEFSRQLNYELRR